eukprot:11162168-Lingulodinium_polyedra.AAC.1
MACACSTSCSGPSGRPTPNCTSIPRPASSSGAHGCAKRATMRGGSSSWSALEGTLSRPSAKAMGR